MQDSHAKIHKISLIQPLKICQNNEITLLYIQIAKMMKKTVTAILLSCAAPHLLAQSTVAQSAVVQQPQQVDAAPMPKQSTINIKLRPEIVGLWAMDIPNNPQCLEYYNFKDENDLVIKSGDEWTVGQYQYQPPVDASVSTVGVLMMHIQYDNNQKDCSGQQNDQSNEIQQFFIKWDNPRQIQFCADEKYSQCFATLNRRLP